jgi:hypothetical protein
MRASTVRLHFALLAAKGEAFSSPNMTACAISSKLRPCCFSMSLRRILKGLGVGLLICFCPPFFWQWHVTYMPNALLAKAGVASCKGRGVPTLEEEAKPERKGRRSAQAKRGRLGKPLVARDRGGAP